MMARTARPGAGWPPARGRSAAATRTRRGGPGRRTRSPLPTSRRAGSGSRPTRGAAPKNKSVIGGHPASANAPMTASPVALCASEAALGMLLPPVRPSRPGSTPFAAERERIPPYRVVERQRGGEQARSETATGRPATARAAQAEQQPRALPRAAATTWRCRRGRPSPTPPPRTPRRSGPAQVGSHRDRPPRMYGLPRPAQAPARIRRSRARAITASTPTVPNPAEVSADGDSAAKLRWPPAGWASPETVSARMTMISAAVSTPSTRPVISTRSRPSAATSAQAPSAHAHQAACTCRWAAASAGGGRTERAVRAT